MFAEHGYTATSIRAVATAAGVDASLVTHFFGTKEGLLAAAVDTLTPGVPPFLTELDDSSPGVGNRVARAYLQLWEQPDAGRRLRALARAVTDSLTAAARVSAMLSATATARATAQHAGQLQLVFSQLLGTALARYVLQVQPLADMPLEDVAALLGPGLDVIFATPGTA